MKTRFTVRNLIAILCLHLLLIHAQVNKMAPSKTGYRERPLDKEEIAPIKEEEQPAPDETEPVQETEETEADNNNNEINEGPKDPTGIIDPTENDPEWFKQHEDSIPCYKFA